VNAEKILVGILAREISNAIDDQTLATVRNLDREEQRKLRLAKCKKLRSLINEKKRKEENSC